MSVRKDFGRGAPIGEPGTRGRAKGKRPGCNTCLVIPIPPGG